jgi:hypothetical protein
MARSNPDSSSPHPPAEGELLRRIADAMTAMGWLTPVTEGDVERAEQRLAGRIGAGEARGNAAPANGPDSPSSGLVPAPPPGWAGPRRSADLARAARNGRPLPPDVLQAMRRDRDRAEVDADAQGASSPTAGAGEETDEPQVGDDGPDAAQPGLETGGA